MVVPKYTATYGLCGKKKALAAQSSVCYNASTKADGGLVQVLSFFVFVVVVAVGTLGFGYGLSLWMERAASRRCRMPHQMLRRRRIHRQRARCRLEG